MWTARLRIVRPSAANRARGAVALAATSLVAAALAATSAIGAADATPPHGSIVTPVEPSTSAETVSGRSFLWRAGWKHLETQVSPDSIWVSLPDAWIDPATVIVAEGDTPLIRGTDYLLDPRRGRLRLLHTRSETVLLRVTYRAFPVEVAREYRLFTPHPLSGEDSGAGAPVTVTREGPLAALTRGLEDESRLQIAGSKTFTVEVGSQQDLSLEQSLDLSIQGRIGRDIDVRAILSDRDTPLQPEGTSTTLEDLDRVLLEVKGPRASMTMGDYYLDIPVTEFARYGRQLQGVRGDARPGSFDVFAAGATTPGTFASVEFLGEEGTQGPYALRLPGSSSEGTIVAGSETIWLEGQSLVRGEDADYIIDYAQGEVTFTARHPITAYSRIGADFQIATERYERSIYGAGVSTGAGSGPIGGSGSWAPGGSGGGLPRGGPGGRGSAGTDGMGGPPGASRHRARAVWIVERDDRHDPIGLPLDEAEKQALRDAGDQDTDALRSGVRFVGAGQGDYEQVFTDTLATPFFVYAGENAGSYLITFDDVGPGNGDYADSTTVEGDRFFVFVGDENGRYLPGRELARPEQKALLAVRNDARWRAGSLAAEIAVSDYDANTFSSRDDGDNTGLALLLSARSEPWRMAGGDLSAGARWRRLDRRFTPLDRLEASYFALDWNVEPQRLQQGDQRLGVDLGFERTAGATTGGLTVDVEHLDNLRDFSARRGILEASVRRGPVHSRVRVLRTESEDRAAGADSVVRGLRTTETVSLGYGGALLDTRATYRGELRRRGEGSVRQGDFFREGALRLASGSRFTVLRADLEVTRRRTYTMEGSTDQLRDVGDTGRAGLEWRRGASGWVAASYTRRELRPQDERPRSSNDLASLRWLQRLGEGVFQQEGRFELSTSSERLRLQRIEFVGEGQGHYDSLGVFQGIGDYEVFIQELPEPVRLNRIDASFRSELDLSRTARGRTAESATAGPEGAASPGWVQRLWWSSRWVHSWTARVEADEPTSALWPHLGPLLFAARDVPLAEAQLRTDWTALPAARWLSPRLRGELRRNRFGGAGTLRERSQRTLVALRLRSRPAERWSVDLEEEWDFEERELISQGSGTTGGRSGWQSLRTRVDQQVALASRLTASLETTARFRSRLAAAESATVVEATPGLIWNPRQRSRFELRTTRTSVQRRSAIGRPTRDLETAGWRTRLVVNLRLRDVLDLSVLGRESRPDHGRRTRDARVELRATF